MTTMLKTTLGALALAAITAVSAGAATVVNGSFEEGTAPGSFTTLSAGSAAITGWTVSGSIDYIGTYWSAADGVRSIDLNGGSAGAVSQTISVIDGQKYRLSFALSGNTDGDPEIKQTQVGAEAITQIFMSSSATLRPNLTWTTYAFDFTAVGTSTTLVFASAIGGAYGPALDDVSISAIPLPAGGVLLLTALGGIAALRRRKSA